LDIFCLKEIEMDGECGTQGEKRSECRQGLEGNLKERSQLESLGVDGSVVIKWILNKYGEVA
jgi:hypothetical protein